MKYVLAVLVFLGARAESAFERRGQGTNIISLGGASVAIAENSWGHFINPATIAPVSSRTVSASLTPGIFELKELRQIAFSFVEPTSVGSFGLAGSSFGFDLYREVAMGISYGVRVSLRLSLGISVNYFLLSIDHYGSDWALGVDVGGLAELSSDLHWGFAVQNINRPVIGERLPQTYVTGLAYRPMESGLIVFDLRKDVRYPLELHAGIQYAVLDALHLRCGAALDPSTIGGGLGFHYSPVVVDYAFSAHPVLGVTHQLSLSVLLED